MKKTHILLLAFMPCLLLAQPSFVNLNGVPSFVGANHFIDLNGYKSDTTPDTLIIVNCDDVIKCNDVLGDAGDCSFFGKINLKFNRIDNLFKNEENILI
jgi:hypothetical protein